MLISNRIHLIVGTGKDSLSDIIRDFKKYTSKKIFGAMENNPKESRKPWLIWLLKKEDKIWFWEEGYHGEEIFSQDFFDITLHSSSSSACWWKRKKNIFIAVAVIFME